MSVPAVVITGVIVAFILGVGYFLYTEVDKILP